MFRKCYKTSEGDYPIAPPLNEEWLNELRAPVDQFDAQEFNINEYGNIRRPADAYANTQDELQKMAIARRLQEVNSSFAPADSTVRQILDTVPSRYAQHSTEILSEMNRIRANIPKKIKEQSKNVQGVKQENNSDVESKSE